MRIVVLSDFKHDTLRHTQIISRKLVKGLLRNGHDVLPLSYRNVMRELSPIASKRWARRIAKSRTDAWCTALVADYQPDLVVVMNFRNFDRHTIRAFRQAAPKATFMGWYEDSLDGFTDLARGITQELDWFVATGGGDHLRHVAQSCSVRAALVPNPCDPDLERPYDAERGYACEVLFVGKIEHKSRGTDAGRAGLIRAVAGRFNLTTYGSLGGPVVLGLDYFRRLAGAKIVLSVNASNDIRMYHSDRLINSVGCGAFVVGRAVPDGQLLFADGKHLAYFETPNQCLELIDYYLDHDDERRQIAKQGMEHAHKAFNCQRIARDIVDLATTGHYDAPWREIF